MTKFDKNSTADEVLSDTDLTGKTAFITGGYSGLGRETARAMAAKGAHVIIAGRDAEKAREAAEQIKAETGNDQVETIVLDLGSLDSVRTAAAEARERFDKIDLLINNAGVMACPEEQTADGFEKQFGTNHLGHFALTNGLMELIEKGERARIVNLSSSGHHMDEVHFDDINFANRPYDKWLSYGQAKTANVLFTVGLEQRFGERGIHSFAVHPGVINTNLARHMTEEDFALMSQRLEGNLEPGASSEDIFKSIPQGAATSCWAATAPELEGKGGLYAEDCHIAKVDDVSQNSGVRSYAIDPEKAEQLWAMSEQMVNAAE